jgi:hypothetical protein
VASLSYEAGLDGPTSNTQKQISLALPIKIQNQEAFGKGDHTPALLTIT